MGKVNDAGAGSEALTVRAWFGTIARYFPLDELHLFNRDMKYLVSARVRRRKQEIKERFPAEKSVFDVVDKKFARQIVENLEKVLNGDTVSFEAEHMGRRYLSHAVPMYNPNNRETYVLIHSTDVTELSELEYRPPLIAAQRNRKLPEKGTGSGAASGEGAFLEVIPLPIFFVDAKGKILGANRSFRHIVGYGQKEILGLVLADLAPGLSGMAWDANYERIKREDHVGTSCELKHSGGRMIKCEIEFTYAEEATGNLACAFVRATGQEEKDGEEVNETEEKFRLISENVPDLMAVLDLAGRHVYVNPSYRSIITNPESLLGKEVLDIIHADDREKVKVVLQEGLSTGVEQRIEFRMLAPDGSVRHVEARGRAVHDVNGNLRNAVIVSRDVTDRKKLEEQYFRNQRIESLGTLAGGISHDLNNVLTPVILGVEALKRVQMEERGLAILKSIGSSLSRGRDIVKQVLTFARGVEGGTMLIQPRHILKEAVALMKETFPKSIAIVENIPKALWLINGDATRIDQLVMNLCVNARDAMPEGGILYISAEDTLIDEQFAAMEADAKAGPYVQFTVQDTGVGMTREIRDHIFEPFFTTKETGKGTGLGLSIVHTIVKAHSGFMTTESEPGKGTTFKVYIPAVEVSEVEKVGGADEKLLSGRGELLLVVDDEVSVCQITKQTLEAFGYRVLTASDGTEAVALFAENRKAISLVVMDIAMPIMDGPRTIRALRKLKPEVKIIASSGIVPEDQLNLDGMAPPNAFLSKPYTSDRLLRTIRSVLETD